MKKLTIALASLLTMLIVTSAQARDQIKIVGSSTVFPYATIVAERFGSSGKFKTPVIESTGTGGGAKLFCAGVGAEHPDGHKRITKLLFLDWRPKRLTFFALGRFHNTRCSLHTNRRKRIPLPNS